MRERRNVTVLRSLLGLSNAFCRFILNFARIANTPSKKLGKNQLQTFEDLINEDTTRDSNILTFSIIALHQGRYIVDTDACDKQVGAVRLHKQLEGPPRPTIYWSMSLTPANRLYNTAEGECLAVEWALLFSRPYLEGS